MNLTYYLYSIENLYLESLQGGIFTLEHKLRDELIS